MKEIDFELIYRRMLRAAKVYQDNDLALFLGISPQAVFGAKKKKQIPKTWFSTVQEKTGVTREELCQPPPTPNGEEQVETPEEKLLRTYKGNLTKSVASQWNNEPGQLPEPPRIRTEQDFSIEEMLADTKDVLESDTVYRQALASNIRAFKQAVINEGKMKNTDEKIDQMMRQIEALTTIVLQGQAPVEPEKKRAGNDH